MNKNEIQTQDTKRKRYLTSTLRFRGTFSEDLFPNFSLDNSWVSTVKIDRIRS